MKTIYKILVAFLAISLMIGTTSANFEIQDNGIENIQSNHPTHNGGAIDHTYQKGILTIPIDQIQKPETQEALKAWQYEDIEIT